MKYLNNTITLSERPSCITSTLTYRIQSMATMSVMSSGGRPTDVSTITMVTKPA